MDTISYLNIGSGSNYEIADLKARNEVKTKAEASAVQALASGSPVGVYANLETLQGDVKAIKTKVYLTIDDGGWNYYNGEAWVKGGTYLSAMSDKSLSITDRAADAKVVGDKVNFLNDTVADIITGGILEYSETKAGGFYNSEGVWTAKESYGTYKYVLNKDIKYMKFFSYTGGNVPSAVFFDSADNFIKSVNRKTGWNRELELIDIPYNAAYFYTANTEYAAGTANCEPIAYVYKYKDYNVVNSLNNIDVINNQIQSGFFELDWVEQEPLESYQGATNRTNILTYNPNQKSYKYKIYGFSKLKVMGHAGGSLPLVSFLNKKEEIISYVDAENEFTSEYQEIKVPENAVYCIVNLSAPDKPYDLQAHTYKLDFGKENITDAIKENIDYEIENIKNSIKEDINNKVEDIEYEIENIYELLRKEELKNDIIYKDFDKAYFVLTIDDANKYLPLMYNVCHELGVPLCPAIIPSNLETVHDTADGKTVKEICDLIVADGGEILSHSGKYITEDSTYDDYVEVFRNTKKALEQAGYNVRGIVTAGGENYLRNDIKLDKWARKYYDYSDQNGLKTSIPYSRDRIWFHDWKTLDNVKSIINSKVTSKSFVVSAMHGADDASDLEYIDNFKQIIQYILSLGNDKAEIVTWSYVHDKFGITALEKRITALENKEGVDNA